MADRFFREAFIWPVNLLALGGAAAASLVLVSPLPALVALGLELVYLGTVPSLPGFKRAIRARRLLASHEAEQKLVDGLMAELAPSQREHYLALRDLRDKILDSCRRMPGGVGPIETSASRIDALLVAFARLLKTLDNYRRYLSGADRKVLERELAELRVELAGSEGSNELRQIKRRRVEILERRLERFDRAAQSREVVSHQLASIEDMVRLLHEQSLTMRDPAVVGEQLEQLSREIQSTDESVAEMERFMSAVEDVSPSPGGGAERPRVR